MFAIGYDGASALVDGQAKRRYGRLGTAELTERSLFRAAYCSALRSGAAEELDLVASAYNAVAGTAYKGGDPALARLFGVMDLPAEAVKAKVL